MFDFCDVSAMLFAVFVVSVLRDSLLLLIFYVTLSLCFLGLCVSLLPVMMSCRVLQLNCEGGFGLRSMRLLTGVFLIPLILLRSLRRGFVIGIAWLITCAAALSLFLVGFLW